MPCTRIVVRQVSSQNGYLLDLELRRQIRWDLYRKYFRHLLLVDTVLTATDNCDSERDGEIDKQIEINRRRVNQDPKRLKHAMDTGGRKENNVQVLFFQEIQTSAG